MAQSAVSAIRSGCQMLSEGRADLDKFKKGTEQAIADAKAIYKEVTGLWSWVKGLFGVKNPEANTQAPVSLTDQTQHVQKTQKRIRVKEPELTYEEYKARSVHEIFEHMKIYFETLRQLKQACDDLEAESSTTDKVADNAIDLIEIRWQIQQMQTQVREAMSWTPETLGLQDLYKQFLQTYDDILEQQEFARQLKLKRERDAKWQRELLRNHRIDRAVIVMAVLILILWMWGMLLSLEWLVRIRNGSLWE
jgi:hypothetical protein